MPLDQPYPELDELLAAIGEAGQCLGAIAAGSVGSC
jgi:hypothetical protein